MLKKLWNIFILVLKKKYIARKTINMMTLTSLPVKKLPATSVQSILLSFTKMSVQPILLSFTKMIDSSSANIFLPFFFVPHFVVAAVVVAFGRMKVGLLSGS